MFAVFDSKAGNYGVPFFMRHTAQAIRSFEDLARDKQSYVYNHAADYSLTQFGSFDDMEGTMEVERPTVVARGSDYVSNGEAKIAKLA